MRKIRIDFKRMKEVVSKVIRKDIIILIIAILVLFYVLVQASVVPFWNKELETEHIDVVYSDMTSLKSDLTDVAQHGIPRSSMIHLGVLYPNRFLFFNPAPGAAGNLTVENVGITGSYTASEASTHQISYDSSRIIYELDGIIPGPKLVYEHGIIIWDWGDNRTVTANNQSLINDDTGTVFIPVVNANPCVTSSVETEIFEIYPYSNTSDRAGVEYVTITLDTDYPELWQELLKEHIKAGLVSVSNQTKKIRIRSSTLPYISLPDQPAPGFVSSGIITFSKEQPAVLTIPAAIMQNATVEKKVTSTPKVTPTPTPTARARVSGGGGGGGIADEPPIVTTENATNVSATSATLNMGFEFHDYRHVRVQFRYKAEGASGWNETGWVSQNGSGSHTYMEQLANLSANTTYYFVGLRLYNGTELNGTWLNFTTTREPIPQTIWTGNATNVSTTSATLNMGFEFNDYSPVQVQFSYKAEGASGWNETGWVSQNGSGSHTYMEQLANLSANTTYYFVGLRLYNGTELNGTWLNFTTTREPIPQTIWTGNATNVSTTSATLNMGFEFNDYSPVQVQFRYKAEGARGWNATGWVSQNGSGAHTYAEPIANLSANTTYYFMALLLYDGTELNGTKLLFTTSREPIPPTVWTGNATDISPNSATRDKGFGLSAKTTYYSMAMPEKATCIPAANVTLDMGFEFHDYSSVQVQFRYKAEGATGWTDTGWVQQNGSGTHTYAKQITNLSPNTTYYYMAMLLYHGMEVNGTVHSFTTCKEPILPTVVTENVTSVSVATATLNMGFEFNDYSPVQVQFMYKAEGARGWNETCWVSRNGSIAHTHAESIANLSCVTTYYFKAQLRYDRTVIEGAEKSFMTLEPPAVRTKAATNISDSTATLNMALDFKKYNTVQVQFKYKAEGASVWNETDRVSQNGSQTYSKSIANLSAITTYYFKAQVLYDSTEIEGVEKSFMTLEPPAVHTKSATNITDATATLNMAFDFNDYDSVHVQFRYKANDASAWNDTGWVAQNGSGFHWYREPIAGLSSSTVYLFKAQLRYDGRIIEGTMRSFSTMEKPTVSTKKAIVQKLPRGWAATLKMDYNFKDYDQGYVRFAYKKVGDADWDHTDWMDVSHSGTYDELIMGVEGGTTYYFYAQLKYGDENNIKGDTLTFKTLGPR